MNISEKLLFNLSIISKLPVNTKLATTNGELKYDNSYLNPIKRFISGNNRQKTLNDIIIIINQTIEYIQLIDNKKEFSDIKTLLLNELEKSMFGLTNLKETYINDSIIVSNIDIIIQKISNFIKNYGIVYNKKNNECNLFD